MRFAGIDIASETHVLAIVAADGTVTVKATPFTEDDIGYQKALTLLGTPGEALIAMEATGHYWKNLFAVLAAAGHAIALLNPLRTHRFAGVDLERTKTDAIDACMHKLLLAIYSVAKHRRAFVPQLANAGART
jgi:transposase